MNWLSQIALIIVSALVGAWVTHRLSRYQQRHAFFEQQLREFYSPLLGLREEIRLKGVLRVRLHATSDEEWRRLCEETKAMHNPIEASVRLSKERAPDFVKVIEYDNDQLRNVILPAYRQMLAMFREKPYLADEETHQYLPALAEFVDLWDRCLTKTIPWEVIEKLGPSEKELLPFYEHLQKKHDELRKILADGKA
ncbi:MAG: hypothetical protein A3H28_14240 [Acidobacteria bacterium RIFCSPLOWO2_02_FULL_61_28]|nr:MAG: hypothetical protein A3H28_14240 [Acidobacteria bacterium RIFCSPLOWO2_02_FULL_61_28]